MGVALDIIKAKGDVKAIKCPPSPPQNPPKREGERKKNVFIST